MLGAFFEPAVLRAISLIVSPADVPLASMRPAATSAR